MIEGGFPRHLTGREGYAGFTRYFVGAVNRLLSHGHDVVLVSTRHHTPIHEELERLGCSTYALGCYSSWQYARGIFQLARIIRQERIDILHLVESIQAAIGGVAGLLAGRGSRIFHRHHIEIPGPIRYLTGIARISCHQTMAVSEAVAARARQEGLKKSRVCVALNGVVRPREVLAEETQELRNRLGIEMQEKVVVIVGHLRPEKGHRFLMQALDRIAGDLEHPLNLIIVGGGPLETKIRKESGSFSSFRTHMVGHQADIALWFSAADVAAVPSSSEPFGLVAAEAMACSRPVVASDVDGLAEIIQDAQSGYLVAPDNPSQFGEAIARVLRDDQLAATLGRRAQDRHSEMFSVEAMADRWLDCYNKVVNRQA